MKIDFSICEYTNEAIVCKVTLGEAQLEKAQRAISENPSDMFERLRDDELDAPVAETTVDDITCITHIEEELVLSIKVPAEYQDDIFFGEDREAARARAIADNWMLFIPHLKIFL